VIHPAVAHDLGFEAADFATVSAAA
jgi:hypothetical protein